MFPCAICDVKLNSMEQRRAHCRGKNHLKRVAAREKAIELGTDFDSTPDHCDVCNVPLTSKMTAIDHFKGKMHQKKVKAVEDLRQGFRNFCDVCDVRLQSLKVSEAHFNGKQHRKRERKSSLSRGKDKNSTNERKPRETRLKKVGDISQTSFGTVNNPSSSNSSSTWERLNCDNESDSKDPLSEFRSSLRSKPNSPDTPLSTSPNDSNKSYFSYEKTAVKQESTFSNNELSCEVQGNHFSNSSDLCQPCTYENVVTSRCNVFESIEQQKAFFSVEDVFEENTTNSWESKAKHLPNYLNETCSNSLKESRCVQSYTLKNGMKNGVPGGSHELTQIQRVLNLLRQTVYPISSGDIARKLGCVSPSEVNVGLVHLEKLKIVSKSGYSPILWSLATPLRTQNSPQPPSATYSNGQPDKYPVDSSRETQFFQTTRDLYLIKGFDVTMKETFPPAILSNASTTTPNKALRVMDNMTSVFESNLINLFQLNGPLTTYEISEKLNVADVTQLIVVLQTLLKRRLIVKESESPERWRLASVSRSNGVGVIGEERKRKSPVQNGHISGETSRERTPTPPQLNGFCEQGLHGFRNITNPEVRVSMQNKECNFSSKVKTNGDWLHLNRFNEQTSVSNGSEVHQRPVSEGPGYFHNSHILNQGNRHEFGKHMDMDGGGSLSRSPSLMKETNEFRYDLTQTALTGYQKELYEQAMQEDVVCYLPTGTGQGVVMASVVHHMLILNPTKQALVVVEDTVCALDRVQCLRKELLCKNKRKKINISLLSGELKQSNGKRQVVVAKASSCLRLLKCGAISWKDTCLLVFDQAGQCLNDNPSHQILRDYYIKSKTDFRDGHVPKLLGFIDSSAGDDNLTKTVAKFNNVLGSMGDVFLSCVTHAKAELEESKRQSMFVCVSASLSKEEQRMFDALHCYLMLVFENLASQWQPLNSYKELLELCFQMYPINGEAFEKLVRLTGQPLEKRLPANCVKTWQHYVAICEVIIALVECGEDFAKDLLGNLKREAFGFSWANDVGLPANELSLDLLPGALRKKLTWGSEDSNQHGSGLRELIEQLMIIQWENARVSSERPLALVIVKLRKTAKLLANYLARYPELAKRNVKTTFVDGSHSCQQKAVVSAIKRRQYQVIVSTDDVEDNLDLPHFELVILLDQPTTHSALVQLRKRQGTNVVALYRELGGEKMLKELLEREERVERAIAVIRGEESAP